MPGQVAASGATRQLVAQLLSRHRVLQGGTAKTEAGRRCEEEDGKERRREEQKEMSRGRRRITDEHSELFLFTGFAYTLSMK